MDFYESDHQHTMLISFYWSW